MFAHSTNRDGNCDDISLNWNIVPVGATLQTSYGRIRTDLFCLRPSALLISVVLLQLYYSRKLCDLSDFLPVGILCISHWLDPYRGSSQNFRIKLVTIRCLFDLLDLYQLIDQLRCFLKRKFHIKKEEGMRPFNSSIVNIPLPDWRCHPIFISVGAVDGLAQLSWRWLVRRTWRCVSAVMLMSHCVAFAMTTLTTVTVEDAEGSESVFHATSRSERR